MQLTLAAIFGDHMVLQQALPNPVWGTATPGAEVTVSFRGQRVSTRADGNGGWSVTLAPLTASAQGAELEVHAALPTEGQTTLTLSDVLVGEVWVCSGQSNMEWQLVNSTDGPAFAAAAHDPALRLFTVPKRASLEPCTDIPGGAWRCCSPQEATTFSAVGYHFGLELRERLGVPVGLINSSWGGTVAEAWTSRAGLLAEPQVAHLVTDFEAGLPRMTELEEQWKADCAATKERTRDVSNVSVTQGWAAAAQPSGTWQDIDLPCIWQAAGLNFSGVVWFRKEVTIPARWAGQPLELSIGATDKSDVTYFNGVQVGSVTMAQREDSWSFQRTYPVPAELVKPGVAVIAVRVHSDCYAGGMTGPAANMKLTPAGAKAGDAIELAGIWRYAVEVNYGRIVMPPAPLGPTNANSPTTLFGGMIHPLIPLALRGAIWYQGESNASRHRQYRALFPALINDWRRCWKRPDLAFHFVQLANHLAAPRQPGESDWARLREAQTMTLKLPHTGMAVAIDIGDANDIHPRNKRDVGRRLAFNALHTTYGQREVVPCGPLFKQAQCEGAALRVSLTHAAGGLVCRGEKLTGFAIAGADGKFVWADARIDGETVLVSSPAVPEPIHVRYGWADNPPCNLYNAAGLPASPFRSDVD